MKNTVTTPKNKKQVEEFYQNELIANGFIPYRLGNTRQVSVLDHNCEIKGHFKSFQEAHSELC